MPFIGTLFRDMPSPETWLANDIGVLIHHKKTVALFVMSMHVN